MLLPQPVSWLPDRRSPWPSQTPTRCPVARSGSLPGHSGEDHAGFPPASRALRQQKSTRRSPSPQQPIPRRTSLHRFSCTSGPMPGCRIHQKPLWTRPLARWHGPSPAPTRSWHGSRTATRPTDSWRETSKPGNVWPDFNITARARFWWPFGLRGSRCAQQFPSTTSDGLSLRWPKHPSWLTRTGWCTVLCYVIDRAPTPGGPTFPTSSHRSPVDSKLSAAHQQTAISTGATPSVCSARCCDGSPQTGPEVTCSPPQCNCALRPAEQTCSTSARRRADCGPDVEHAASYGDPALATAQNAYSTTPHAGSRDDPTATGPPLPAQPSQASAATAKSGSQHHSTGPVAHPSRRKPVEPVVRHCNGRRIPNTAEVPIATPTSAATSTAAPLTRLPTIAILRPLLSEPSRRACRRAAARHARQQISISSSSVRPARSDT